MQLRGVVLTALLAEAGENKEVDYILKKRFCAGYCTQDLVFTATSSSAQPSRLYSANVIVRFQLQKTAANIAPFQSHKSDYKDPTTKF